MWVLMLGKHQRGEAQRNIARTWIADGRDQRFRGLSEADLHSSEEKKISGSGCSPTDLLRVPTPNPLGLPTHIGPNCGGPNSFGSTSCVYLQADVLDISTAGHCKCSQILQLCSHQIF